MGERGFSTLLFDLRGHGEPGGTQVSGGYFERPDVLGAFHFLRDSGLPQTELPTALLFFNVGVEIGQILFVIALLAAFFIVRPVLVSVLRSAADPEMRWTSLTQPASYVIGGVASYWMIERIAGFWI